MRDDYEIKIVIILSLEKTFEGWVIFWIGLINNECRGKINREKSESSY